jgi:cytochrome c556
MKEGFKKVRNAALTAALCGGLVLSASAQTPPPAAPANDSAIQANQAIKARKAIFTLVGANFGPIGAQLSGKAPFDGTEALKRAERVAFLAGLAQEAFPDNSKTGDTKAKPEAWDNKADLDKKLQEFVQHSNDLVAALRKDKTNVEAFKAAAVKVGGDCKGCHDDYRAK